MLKSGGREFSEGLVELSEDFGGGKTFGAGEAAGIFVSVVEFWVVDGNGFLVGFELE